MIISLSKTASGNADLPNHAIPTVIQISRIQKASLFREKEHPLIPAGLPDRKHLVILKIPVHDKISAGISGLSGAVKLHKLSPLVSEKTIFLTSLAQQHIKAQGVFSGVIYDNNGTLRCEEGERIGDRELFTGMDWFVEGVEIYE